MGTAWAQAQPLTVYSDLAEIDAAGKATAPETPREILSPALVRNGFTSFQLVVEAQADKKWWLFIGQNPTNAVKVTMYQELDGKLEPVELPRQSSGTEVLWIDVWTDRKAPIARIKIEPELMIDDDWVIYPIEARVMEAVAPDMPPVQLGVSLQGGACGIVFEKADRSFVDGLRTRNLEQDMRLAQLYSVMDEVRKRNNACAMTSPKNPEWYLSIRDYLYRLR